MKIIKIKDCFNCNYVSYVGSTTVARWQCTKKMENGYFIQFDKANNVIDPRCPLDDYDSGLLNDYGSGNVEWWQDYIREEVARCNEYWRDYLERSQGKLDANVECMCSAALHILSIYN